jgi:hypothetical protein
MFTISPFAALSASIAPAFMQAYVALMILLVVGGTLFDVWHKKSANYFFDRWRNAKKEGPRQVGVSEMVSLAIRAVLVDGLTSPQRAIRLYAWCVPTSS